MEYKIVVADDHYPIRKYFEYLLADDPRFKVYAIAANGEEALQAVEKYKPFMVILDLNMPVMDGFKVLDRLVKKKSPVKIIAHTGYDDERNIAKCIELGACGILPKDNTPDIALTAINSVIETGYYYNHKTLAVLQKEISTSKKFKPRFNEDIIRFNEIEMKVVYHFCNGAKSSKEIGDKMNYNERSVNGIKRRMMQRLNASHFFEVAIYCIQQGFIDMNDIHFTHLPE